MPNKAKTAGNYKNNPIKDLPDVSKDSVKQTVLMGIDVTWILLILTMISS